MTVGAKLPLAADLVTEEGQDSLRFVGGVSDVFNVTVSANGIAASQGFMIVDLSDTINWPHIETGHINLKLLEVSLNPDDLFRGSVSLGFLTNVDATDGDYSIVNPYNFFKKSSRIDLYKYYEASHFCLKPSHHFGPIILNDPTWQTDVPLQGPDGMIAYPSGDLDFVAYVMQTAGSIDVNLTVGYETVAEV